jgi:formamidopyrimidine-DNA glycosylase
MSGRLTVSPPTARQSLSPGSRTQVEVPSPAQAGAFPENTPPFHKHDHLILHTPKGTITFNDPRRFGLILLASTNDLSKHPLLKSLGPEPLSAAFAGPVLHTAFKGKKAAVKIAIMDQRVVVGVGNIYASESLFRAKIHPARPAGKLTPSQADKLAAAIKAVLTEAVKAGGSSLRDYRHGNGQLGYFQHHFQVYDRKGQPCPVCATPIRQTTLGQRSTYWCLTCQKR